MRPDEEPNLPDDLALLGDELAASAAHLANVYPAPKFAGGRAELAAAEALPAPRPQRSLRSWALVLGGMACAVVVMTSLAYLIGAGQSASLRAPQLVATAPDFPAAISATENGSSASAVPVLPVVQQAVDISPAVFHDLSAPELEGMLDLLEQEPAAMRMSI